MVGWIRIIISERACDTTMRYLAAIPLIILLLSGTVSADSSPDTPLLHTMDITLDIEGRSMKGRDTILLRGGESATMTLLLRNGSVVDRAVWAGKPLHFRSQTIPDEEVNAITITLPPRGRDTSRDNSLTIDFHGTFPDIESARGQVRRGVAFVRGGIIGQAGAFLPSHSAWYPQEVNERALYDITITTPKGYEAVMEGERMDRSSKGNATVNRWKTHQPLQGINLVVGRYVIDRERYKGIEISTFLFKRDNRLSKTYREKIKSYLDLYRGLFPPYPFKKFAVVESFLPTGYGMPSFTLLGSSIIRLPFIPDTSLGHEFVHNWWGNSVFINATLGNWAEALTSYTADHLYAEKRGNEEAVRYRKRLLVGYKNYSGSDPIPLREFVDSTSLPSRVVGYNKGTMLFHSLRRLLGDDLFFAGLHRFYRDNAFKKATWEDIQHAFEEVSGSGLEELFRGWLDREDSPSLTLVEASMEEIKDGARVSLVIDQGLPPYPLTLPLRFTTRDGQHITRYVELKKGREEVAVTLPEEPLSLEIDPDYDLFRILSDGETPPTLGTLLGDRDGIIVLPAGTESRAVYRPLAEMLSREYHLTTRTEREVDKAVVREHSLFIMGGAVENNLFEVIAKALPDGVEIGIDSITINSTSYDLDKSTVVLSVKNPFNPAKVIGVIFGAGGQGRQGGKGEKGGLARIGRRIPHLTGKSYLIFGEDGTVERGLFEGEKPLYFRFQ
jgi:hypothetical protein